MSTAERAHADITRSQSGPGAAFSPAGARRPIYLDHHATTPVDPRVAGVVYAAMCEAFGNPNSADHAYGDQAAALVAGARREVAVLVGGEPDGVHFTSGSTEGLSLALAHAVRTRPHQGAPLRVAASTVEHHATRAALADAAARGEVVVRWLPVDARARLDPAAVARACDDGVDLVCVMAANNEVGTRYPVEQIAALAEAGGARTLVDATQAAGREPLAVDAWGVTYLTLSAHKMYGPKGVGAVVTAPGLRLRDRPGGTPNVPGIAGLGEACRLRRLEMAVDEPAIAARRDRLQAALTAGIAGLVVNGDVGGRLSHNLHVSVPDVPNDAVLARVRGTLALSTGAACASGALEPSPVLRAMGLPESVQEGALRISLGKFTTDADVAAAAACLIGAVRATRAALSGRSAGA